MAKDHATRQLWLKDDVFLTSIRNNNAINGLDDFQRGAEMYFQESDLYYEIPCSSLAFYHRAVNVKGASSNCGSELMNQIS